MTDQTTTQKTKRQPRASRRFTEHTPPGEKISRLAGDHPAAVEGRTRYPKRREDPLLSAHVLKNGKHNRKIGSHVTKGAWKGAPIYTLTLEERATCPRSCHHWLDCFGNKMNWSTRYEHGARLEAALEVELEILAKKHELFVVRLHVLGDFYGPGYICFWRSMLSKHSGLRIFGYTAHDRLMPMGEAIRMARSSVSWRPSNPFAIRFSVPGTGKDIAPMTAVSYDKLEDVPPGVIPCPAETGKTDCCGTCALCWSTDKPIAFITH